MLKQRLQFVHCLLSPSQKPAAGQLCVNLHIVNAYETHICV